MPTPFHLTIEEPDVPTGTVEWLDRLTIACRTFDDGTLDVTVIASDGIILGTLSVQVPAWRCPECYEAACCCDGADTNNDNDDDDNTPCPQESKP